jgi:23S rRNA pseudouridine2457 synthase
MTQHRHFILHKPYGYLSQFITNQNKQKRIKLLGELYDFPEGTMAIGRLDKDSEGLLLLTTDGKVSDWVCSSKIDKEYYVQVDGKVTDEAINQLKTGVEISINSKKYMTKPCQAAILDQPPQTGPRVKKIRSDRHGPTNWLTITINEGKFRQIRKMTAAVGFPTLRLIRVRVGHITLDKMAAGEVIEMDDFGF